MTGPGVDGLLAPLQAFLDNDAVSEIMINRPREVFIEEHGVMHRFEVPEFTDAYLRRLFMMIANVNKQVLSESMPLLSGNLPDGSRVQLVIPPASSQYTLSIRKFSLKSLNIGDYGIGLSSIKSDDALNVHYKNKNWQAFIHAAILSKKTILISGATSSGKTTFLNACLALIPMEERLITLEDTFEIKMPHPNRVSLKAHKQIGHQETCLTMQDLVQASLRLRPERIIMGEIRGKEIFDFVSACATGHNGSMATLHADNPKMAFMRMAQLYKLNPVSGMQEKDIYEALHSVIDVIVQLKKTAVGRCITAIYYKDHAHSAWNDGDPLAGFVDKSEVKVLDPERS